MTTPEDRQLIIDQIQEAKDQILEAIENLRNIARNDSEHGAWAERSIIANIECSTTENHNWMDRSSNLDTWMKALEEDTEAEAMEESEAEGEDEMTEEEAEAVTDRMNAGRHQDDWNF